ncbi:MAG: hypothetical protein J4452_00625 [Candidatus Aenigmarchaeota archaeon]|nr:hypothetical protein [Candidatus Aenigmarchaeota archaeon]
MTLNLPTLEEDLSSIDLTELAKSAEKAKGAYSEILDLRNVVYRQIADEASQDSEVTKDDIRHSFDVLMASASDALEKVGPKKVPERIRREREEYAGAIRSTIDKRENVELFDLGWIIPQTATVVGHTIDYLSGPIFTYQILSSFPDKEAVEKNIVALRDDVMSNVQYYVYTYEQERFRERQKVRDPKLFKIFGKGEKPRTRNYLRPLVYGLHEMSEPKLLSIGKEQEELGKARSYVEGNLIRYSTIRMVRPPSEKAKLRVLIDKPEVRSLITESIRPTSVLDLLSGHPTLLKLRNIVEQDKELSERTRMISDLYLRFRGHGNYCTQAELTDILYDVVYGHERHKHVPFSLIFTAFGYNPFPIIETRDYQGLVKWNVKPKLLTEQEFLRTTFEDAMRPAPSVLYT